MGSSSLLSSVINPIQAGREVGGGAQFASSKGLCLAVLQLFAAD